METIIVIIWKPVNRTLMRNLGEGEYSIHARRAGWSPTVLAIQMHAKAKFHATVSFWTTAMG
jgi:hypothetical protein